MAEATHPRGAPGKIVVYRHRLIVRITHWVNVICLTALLASGMQIFNAHPALYWGEDSDFDKPVFAIGARKGEAESLVGVTSLFGRSIETTGVLGVSAGPYGAPVARAFPAWSTLPSWQDLASGRRWHFFFAWLFVLNGLVYLLCGLVTGHFWRDLVPSRNQVRHIGRSIRQHLRLRFPHGEEARYYNVLQKLAYLAVIFIILPLLVLAGLTMSPALNAAFPQLVTLFDGRQSARTIHFVAGLALVLFVIVHIAMVLVSGVLNNMRSMITGRFAISTTSESHESKRI